MDGRRIIQGTENPREIPFVQTFSSNFDIPVRKNGGNSAEDLTPSIDTGSVGQRRMQVKPFLGFGEVLFFF